MSAAHHRRQSLTAVAAVIGWFASPAIACFAWPFRTGVSDVRMAVAVWRMDPDRVRGRGCALFYLVAGANKIAMVGICLMGVFFFLFLSVGKRFQPQQLMVEVFVGLFFAGMIAYGLAGLTSLVALVYARWHRLRIWIDENPQPDLVREGIWPPVADFKENGAVWVVALPILLAMAPACCLLDHSLVMAYITGMTAGVLALMVIRPIIADHPRECYSELTEVQEH